MAGTVSNTVKMAALNALSGMGGILASSQVGLFINNIVPGPNSVAADFELCEEGGLEAQETLTYPPAFIADDGLVVKVAPTAPFVAQETPAEPVILYGWVALNTIGTAVAAAERFPIPIVISTVGQGVDVVARIPWGG